MVQVTRAQICKCKCSTAVKEKLVIGRNTRFIISIKLSNSIAGSPLKILELNTNTNTN